MPTVDLWVKNGRLVLRDRIVEADMVVDHGKIVKIGVVEPGVKSDRVIDAKGNLVIPGCVDTHVHSREPHGQKTPAGQEDFVSLTQAAAAGGYTTVFDMPVTCDPPTTTVEGFRVKKRLAEKRCIVDYAFYGGAGFGNLDDLKGLDAAGVIGFKTFTRELSPESEGWRGVILGEEGPDVFLRLMEAVAETGRPLSIHCEDDRLIKHLREPLQAAGDVGLDAYYRSAPNASEFLEVARSISLAKTVAGARINIAHLSTAEGVSMVKEAKNYGDGRFTAETCPHYLLLTDKDLVEKLGPYGKIYPPLRSDWDREALWRGLNEGVIDFLATDHAPHLREAKEPGWSNIFEAASGVPGLETALPLMLTQMNQGRISLFRLVEVMSRNPAEAFGIGSRKGALEVGRDADFVVVDPKLEKILREEDMYTRSSAKVFDGWQVSGAPVLTAVRGEVVMESGEVSGKPGYGEFISPSR
ncbi:MAG: dihydroorotase [Thaumarchaeota archaeon]|nr:dihydroorotase [Nitrososphaerota archaeon]MCL5317690.1 dihydroorotase [Nitrososphaerota archaeon]